MTITYAPIDPPGTRGSLQELRLPWDTVRWTPDWIQLALSLRQPPVTDPQAVLLLPGFGAGPRSMQVMASFLRRRGHDVHHWGLGLNTGKAQALLAALRGRIDGVVQKAGRPVVAIGWSLGGYLARELARDEPDSVRQVITLGSPVIGGPRFTAVAGWYRATGHDLAAMEIEIAERFSTPLRAPVTALYSKRDGVVAWQACIDHWSPSVKHIEVSETHLGMGFSPRVLPIIAAELEPV